MARPNRRNQAALWTVTSTARITLSSPASPRAGSTCTASALALMSQTTVYDTGGSFNMDAHATTGRLSCRRAVGPSIGRSHRPARTLRTFSRRVLLRPSPRQPRIASAAQARQRLRRSPLRSGPARLYCFVSMIEQPVRRRDDLRCWSRSVSGGSGPSPAAGPERAWRVALRAGALAEDGAAVDAPGVRIP